MVILKMSFSATILILAILAIRALALDKLPKKTFLVLWGVALCRLFIPFSIPSRFSVYSVVDMLKNKFSAADMSYMDMAVPNIGMTAGTISPTLTNTAAVSLSPIMFVWIIGLLVFVSFFFVTHLQCRREYNTALPVDKEFVKDWQLKHSTRLKLEIRQSDKIAAPLTYGIFRPVVLLPKKTDWADEIQLQYILTHEYVHIQRFDILTKLFLAAALCVHWFNPLVWLMYALANRDIELSCDETVVRTFGETMKSDYALTLIGLEEKKSRLAPLVNNFSKYAIEERINAIMKIKKTSIVGIILAIALVIGTTAVFATNSSNAVGNDSDSAAKAYHLSGTIDGKNYIYTDNGGETWMTEAKYKEKNPDVKDKLEFWGIDEFEEWMEQQRIENQKLADEGSKSFYYRDSETDQWCTRPWTQQDVDELYESWQQQLERMKKGYKYTKDIELSDGALLAGCFEPDTGSVSSAGSTVITLSDGATVELGEFDTAKEAEAAVKNYLDGQVKAGKMTRQEASEILKNKAIE